MCTDGLSMLYEIGKCLTEYTTEHRVLVPWVTCQVEVYALEVISSVNHWDVLYDLLPVGNELLQVETSSAHFFNQLDQMVCLLNRGTGL